MTACWLLAALRTARGLACNWWHHRRIQAACFPSAVLPCRYPLKLAGFWSAQSLWGWIVLLPVTVAQVRVLYAPAAPPMPACTCASRSTAATEADLTQALVGPVLANTGEHAGSG